MILFDSVGVLNSAFVRMLVRLDPEGRFHFATAQSPLGEALFRKYGLRTDSYENNLVLIDGIAFTRLDSFVAVMSNWAGRGGWRDRCCSCQGLFATGSTIALQKIRYALLGRKDSCEIPSAELKAPLIG